LFLQPPLRAPASAPPRSTKSFGRRKPHPKRAAPREETQTAPAIATRNDATSEATSLTTQPFRYTRQSCARGPPKARSKTPAARRLETAPAAEPQRFHPSFVTSHEFGRICPL